MPTNQSQASNGSTHAIVNIEANNITQTPAVNQTSNSSSVSTPSFISSVSGNTTGQNSSQIENSLGISSVENVTITNSNDFNVVTNSG